MSTQTPIIFDNCVQEYLNDPAQILLCKNIREASPSKRTIELNTAQYPCKSASTGVTTYVSMQRIIIYPKVRTYNENGQPNVTEAFIPAVTVCESQR